MVTLTQIRELVLKQEKELEQLILKYNEQYSNKEILLENNVDVEQIKLEIQNSINLGNIETAKILLQDNYELLKNDVTFYSLNGIVALTENDLEYALDNFLKGLELDENNVDILYNMGYLNELLKNNEEAIYFYDKCLQITDDKSFIEELKDKINNLELKEAQVTLLALDFDKDDSLLESIDKKKINFINLVINEESEFENKYYENDITICEVPASKYKEMLDYFIRRNPNCLVIYRDFDVKKVLEEFKDKVSIIYYPSKNYYIDKTDYINHSITMNTEKENCDFCHMIITQDINTYNYKILIEKRKNVYLVDSNINDYLSLDNVLINISYINENVVNSYIKEYSKKIKDEYLKAMYVIASEKNNLNNCLEISKYIYEKYNTEESYHLTMNLLKDLKDYTNLVSFMINSGHCDEIYKSEIIYLNAISKFDLIDFVIDIIIKNYRAIDLSSDKDFIDYKLALYLFELNLFEKSYEKYLKVYEEDEICNCPLVNRNLSYLMYADGNDNYEKHYKLYKELIEEFLS